MRDVASERTRVLTFVPVVLARQRVAQLLKAWRALALAQMGCAHVGHVSFADKKCSCYFLPL